MNQGFTFVILRSSCWKLFEIKIPFFFFHCWNEVNEYNGWITFINIALQETWGIYCSQLWLYKILARAIKLTHCLASGKSSCHLWLWAFLSAIRDPGGHFFFWKLRPLQKASEWNSLQLEAGGWAALIARMEQNGLTHHTPNSCLLLSDGK